VGTVRTESEMLELILSKAKNDERIRAVIMNGSRANPNTKKDLFQDYDIVYLVNGMDTFTSDHTWVDYFGERVMMQMPEDKVLPAADNDGKFAYLMQFIDGNRIDLTLIPIEKKDKLLQNDSLSVLLLDKEGIVGELPPSSDRDYIIKKPTEREFQDVCNEFWWINMNIAKGLWREELTYAMVMYEQVNRNVLIRMIEWSIGTKTDFQISAGKFGKYMKDYLEKDDWEAFTSTYSDGDYKSIWDSLFIMCGLFREMAMKVADQLNYQYLHEDDKRVTEYLKKVRALPKNASMFH
jgi:aminoglycoside 6-adenylyltransferase